MNTENKWQRITPENPFKLPCWLWSKYGACRHDNPQDDVFWGQFTHWHPDQPTAPTTRPEETGELRERIAAAVAKYIDEAALDEVMNEHAVRGLKDDLQFIIMEETK